MDFLGLIDNNICVYSEKKIEGKILNFLPGPKYTQATWRQL